MANEVRLDSLNAMWEKAQYFPLNATYGIMSDKNLMSVKKPVPLPEEGPPIKKVNEYIEHNIDLTRRMYDILGPSQCFKAVIDNVIRKENEKMFNTNILVKIGDKFYKPTDVEVAAVDSWSAAEYRINVAAVPYRQVDVPKPVDPLAIKDVIFNDPATIVLWQDGTKTVVKANHGDKFDREKGLAMAITKKALGNKGKYFDILKKYMKK